MTVPVEPMSSQVRNRRNVTALPLAMASFTVVYIGMLFAVPWLEPAGDDGWGALAYLLSLVVVGVALVAVLIPVVVFSLGARLDTTTRDMTTMRAALVFGGAGLALGLVLSVPMSWLLGGSVAGGLANGAVPAAVGGFVTRLLLPQALDRRWLVVFAWLIAAVPALWLIAALVLVNVR